MSLLDGVFELIDFLLDRLEEGEEDRVADEGAYDRHAEAWIFVKESAK